MLMHANQHLLNKRIKVKQLPKEINWTEYVTNPIINKRTGKVRVPKHIRDTVQEDNSA